jgi:hypothetical protein
MAGDFLPIAWTRRCMPLALPARFHLRLAARDMILELADAALHPGLGFLAPSEWGRSTLIGLFMKAC